MEDESPLDEINEELHQLRRKTDALWKLNEAMRKVVEELSATVFDEPNAASYWAEKLEEVAAQRAMFDENDAALPWLNSFIERVRDAHGLHSVAIITADGAKLRPLSLSERRERLSVLPGGLQTPSPLASSPRIPPSPAGTKPPDEACEPSLPEAP